MVFSRQQLYQVNEIVSLNQIIQPNIRNNFQSNCLTYLFNSNIKENNNDKIKFSKE